MIAAKDKMGGAPFKPRRARVLVETIQDCRLIDMGFQGPKFTWTNGRKGRGNIKERIDRGWCNVE